LANLKKEAQAGLRIFCISVFKGQAPLQSGEMLAASLILEFTGASRAVAARTGTASVVCAATLDLRLAAAPPR
jgi:hypothetical protein